MRLFINDIFRAFNIEYNQINIIVVKSLIAAMIDRNLCYKEKQRLIFDEKDFIDCWLIYLSCLNYFDPNYNRKTDFSLFFKYIIDNKTLKKKINFHALFCPGYTKNGYKEHLGNTTLWKLKALHDIMNMFRNINIESSIICYYSDVFLENCDSLLEPKWKEQLNNNRNLFHMEGKKYFECNCIRNVSDISIFSHEKDKDGFVDKKIISSIPLSTYNAFVKGNENFYNSMGFTKEQMKFRNDRLITMYRMFSDYLNKLDNVVFLPMENMYERENIFSENGTCTMYLKLKK